MPSVPVILPDNRFYDPPQTPLPVPASQQKTWGYAGQPYLLGNGIPDPTSVEVGATYTLENFVPVYYHPPIFRLGTGNLVYATLPNTSIAHWFIGAADTEETNIHQALYNGVTSSPVLLGSSSDGILDAGLESERWVINFGARFFGAFYIDGSHAELSHGDTIVSALPQRNVYPNGSFDFGHGSFPLGDFKFTLPGPPNDVKSADAQKPILARVIDRFGQLTSWVHFLIPPITRATMAIEDDVATIDARKSYDVDDGIDHFTLKTGGKEFSAITTASGDDNRIFTFSVEELRAFTKLALLEGTQLSVEVCAVDRAGNKSPITVSALIPVTIPHVRGLVREGSGKIVFRANTVLWQYPGQTRIWGGEPKTGAIVSSDDDGKTWNYMNLLPWADVTGVKPLDFCAMARGHCTIASKDGQILFRRSFDDQTYEAPKTVCPDEGTKAWFVMNHLSVGHDTLTITNGTKTQLDSEAFGDEGSWKQGDIQAS